MRNHAGWLIIILISVLFTGKADAVEPSWLDAGTHPFTEIRGKPAILHFWATWCVPCRAELPALEAWSQQHPAVQLVPIALDAEIGTAQAFLRKYRIHLNTLHGSTQQAALLGVWALPTTVLIDAQGNIQGIYLGMAPWNNKSFNRKILKKLFHGGKRDPVVFASL